MKTFNIRLLLLSILCVLTLSACEKVLDIDIDNRHVIVLNAIPSEGKQLFVNLSYSHFFLDTLTQHPVDNVQMTIDVNGTRLSPSAVDGCNYFFPYTLCADDSLSLSLSADGQTITAHTYVPRQPRVSNLTAYYDTTQILHIYTIEFDLADYADHRDYYHFTVYSRDSGSRHNLYTDSIDHVDTLVRKMVYCSDHEGEITSDEVSAFRPLGGYFYNHMLFTDRLIDGKEKHVKLMVPLFIDTTEIEPFRHDFSIEIESVTPARFNYIKRTSSATSSSTLFTNPPEMYTNLDGCYGIFAGNAHQHYDLPADTIAATTHSLTTTTTTQLQFFTTKQKR